MLKKKLRLQLLTHAITKKESRAGVTNIRNMRKLLNGGKGWTQGMLEARDGTFCLVGANRKVDGAGEYAALLAIAVAIKGAVDYSVDANGNYLEVDYINEDAIFEYNDDDDRKFRQIAGVLNKAETALMERLEA